MTNVLAPIVVDNSPTVTQYVHWICPTLCGCCLRRTIRWTVVDGAAHTIEFDDFTHIVNQCVLHEGPKTAPGLYRKLKRYHGTKFSPDACRCVVVYWTDELEDSSPVHPIEDIRFTKRCSLHRHHKTAQAHYNAVHAHAAERAQKTLGVGKRRRARG